MKKYGLALLILMILVACSPQPVQQDRNLLYTQAAKTVFVQMTAASALTPSVTPTYTPIPTATITPSPIPSPTPVPPTPTWIVAQAGKLVAPIFLYTRIAASASDDPNYKWNSNVNISPDNFALQMLTLSNNGYSSMTVSQLADAVRKGGQIPPHPFVATFDNSSISVYTKAYPIMKKYGFVGTVYVVVGQIVGGGSVMSVDQMKELVAAGWEFGSKGMTGIDLTKNHDQAGYEAANSKAALGKALGVEIKTFSYPGGATDDLINGARISQWGYQSAAGLGRSSDINSSNLYYLPRYEIQKEMRIADFVAFLPSPAAWIPTEIPTATVVPTAAPGAAPTVAPTTQ